MKFGSRHTISEALINQSLITTAIGAGTTVCLLIILMMTSFFMGWISIRLADRGSRSFQEDATKEGDINRAKAAVITASILKSSEEYDRSHSN